MKFLKDYEFGLNYHPEKAKLMADALSRKSLHASWMMVKEVELVENFRDLNFGVVLTFYNLDWVRLGCYNYYQFFFFYYHFHLIILFTSLSKILFIILYD